MQRKIQRSTSQRWEQECHYAVHFVGGPMDGAQIVTDECPNAEYLVHRSEGREYLYRYRVIEENQFQAEFDGYFAVESQSTSKSFLDDKLKLLLIAAIAGLLTFFSLAGWVANEWS